MGGMPISTVSPRRGGVGPRVGGVAASEIPDEPAVEGRVSRPSTGEGGSLLGAGFLRVGTPSGQVHWTRRVVRHARDASSRVGRTSRWPWLHRTQVGFVSSHFGEGKGGELGASAHDSP